jgi:hypothetical protein
MSKTLAMSAPMSDQPRAAWIGPTLAQALCHSDVLPESACCRDRRPLGRYGWVGMDSLKVHWRR